jgi:hypothetical protein
MMPHIAGANAGLSRRSSEAKADWCWQFRCAVHVANPAWLSWVVRLIP